MKIGVNTLFMIPGEVGGMETYLRRTLLAMAGQFPAVPLVLFTNEENHAALTTDLASFSHVSFVRVNVKATNRVARIVREQLELPGKVSRSGVDVLWSPGYTAPCFCACPQVVTIPDMQYKTHPQDLTRVARMATNILVKAAAWRCQRIIAMSEFSRSEIIKYTAASREKVDVVPLAASPEFAVPIPPERRRDVLAPLLPVDKPYLLSVSASYPHKNLPALVRAFGEIMSAIPHTLVMVGNAGLGESAVQKALDALPDKARVVRLRKLPWETLLALYQGCDVFVFPSLYEGFGLPVLEAMMAGVPVVTTRHGSISEIGGDGVVYFDPEASGALAHRILAVIGWSPADRLRKVTRGRELARKFSWAATASQTVDVFGKAMSP